MRWNRPRDRSGSPRRQSSPGTGRPRSTSRSRAARSSTQLPGPWSCSARTWRSPAWDSSRQGERPRRRFSLDDAHAQIELTDPTRLTAASARATLDLAQWFPWLSGAAAAGSGRGDVRQGRSHAQAPGAALDRPQQADFEAVATPRNVSASLRALPGRLRHGHRTRRDNAAAPELGSAARVSGRVEVCRRPRRAGVEAATARARSERARERRARAVAADAAARRRHYAYRQARRGARPARAALRSPAGRGISRPLPRRAT